MTNIKTKFFLNRKIYLTIIFFIILIISFILSLILGAENLSIQKIYNNDILKNILLVFRLPRSFLVLISGALLAGSGTVFQGYFRNSLADSGIIGVSSGATLGAVLSSFLPITFFSFLNFLISPIVLFAFLGAVGSAFLIYLISKITNNSFQQNSSVNLLLAGSALGSFFSALTSVIILSRDRELHKMYVWTLGSFNGKTFDDLFFILVPSVFAVYLLFLCTKKLDLISSGEKTATSLGLDVKKFRFLVLFSGSLAASCAVCSGGTIGFVGLVAPHIVRNVVSPNHKTLLPPSMLIGSSLLLISDTIARTIIAPAEIPVGVITSLIGAPFFIYIIFSSKGKIQ